MSAKYYMNPKRLLLLTIWMSLSASSLAFSIDNEKRGLKWSGAAEQPTLNFEMGNYRALIIGNSLYRDKNNVWKNLKTAEQDADTVAKLLKNRYHFSDIVLLKNAGRKPILDALKSLSQRAEPTDNILVYYAGHGYMDTDERRGYWIPSDGQGLDDTTYIRNSTIRDEINIIADKTRHTLLLSDSCFSGSLLRGGNRGPQNLEKPQQYYTKVGLKKSVQVLTAGGNEYVDDSYRNSGHSPFTYFLLNELKNNTQPYISLSELANNIIKGVSNNVEQTPEAGVLAGAGDELGEFIFVRNPDPMTSLAVRIVEPVILEAAQKEEINTVKETPLKTIQPSPDNAVFLPAFRF